MFRIKICGITREEDALAAADAGADAIGLNFFSGSKRFVDVARAQAISKSVANSVTRVGVFVNMASADILKIVDRVELDAIQLHGDEPAAQLADFPGRQVIRALRMGSAGTKPLAAHLEGCRGAPPAAVLIDADVSGAYGGTGTVADWTLLAEPRDWLGSIPLILAGGLNAANVAAAIRAVQPAGVDTASGVEARPGVKDPAQMADFIKAAEAAFTGG